jgi:hypothetical protein
VCINIGTILRKYNWLRVILLKVNSELVFCIDVFQEGRFYRNFIRIWKLKNHADNMIRCGKRIEFGERV